MVSIKDLFAKKKLESEISPEIECEMEDGEIECEMEDEEEGQVSEEEMGEELGDPIVNGDRGDTFNEPDGLSIIKKRKLLERIRKLKGN